MGTHEVQAVEISLKPRSSIFLPAECACYRLTMSIKSRWPLTEMRGQNISGTAPALFLQSEVPRSREGTRMCMSLSNCLLHSEVFSDFPGKGHRRGQRVSLDFTGTPEAEDSTIWEMLHYFWELNLPTLKATGHRCLPALSQKRPQLLQQAGA